MASKGGVVAAGSQATAQAGVEILQAGGNAVDAVVASALATSAGEPPLTSLAGGGVLLHYDAKLAEATICDFSPNAPGLGGSSDHEKDFFPVELNFGPATQTFHIGRASAAVPGGLPGLMGALDRWGRLPLTEVVAPVCRLLRKGVLLNDFMQGCIDLLEPILLQSESSRRIFAPGGSLLRTGQLASNPELADTLERMAELGWPAYRQTEWVPLVLAQFGVQAGGCITREDLERYQPEFRASLERSYRGQRIFLPNKPAAGGTLIGTSLAMLENSDLGKHAWGSAEHLAKKIAAMRMIPEARKIEGDPLAEKHLQRLLAEYGRLLRHGPTGPTPPGAPAEGSTTHISALDADGNAAAATISHGEGCGHAIGDTGIIMNNMMGEADLHPAGFFRLPAGQRLATMMSPSLVLSPDGTTTVLGTGGANRIRTAITQVISNLVDFDMQPQAAVDAGRLHWENGVLNIESFDLPGGHKTIDAVHQPGEELIEFKQRHLFFGGVHLVRRAPDGSLTGAGDPRRSGAVLTV